jgi:hypothetical protein
MTHGPMQAASNATSTTEELIGERRLWTAVLVLAVEDWRQGSMRKRRDAERFLFEEEKNFQHVCASAGLDPNDIRRRLLKVGRRSHLEMPRQHCLAA